METKSENKIEIIEQREFEIPYKSIKLTAGILQKRLGYSNNHVPEQINDDILISLEEAESMSDIRAGFVIIKPDNLTISENSMEFNNIKLNTGPVISPVLKKSDFLALFIVTAGENIENQSRKYIKNNDGLKGYILDLCGSEIAEKAADKTEAEIKKYAAELGMSISNRYSPGYCNWTVGEQKKIFSIIPDGLCNVKLTDSSLMKPIKSVSGIIGVGEEIKKVPYSCSTCATPCIRKIKNHY